MSGNRRYWIFGVTSENWRISLERNLWGLQQRYRGLPKKIAKGDILLLFISKIRPFGFHGAFEVVGDWIISNEPVWADETAEHRVIYPFRVEIRTIQLGFAEYETLVPRLEFVSNKDRRRYWVYLKGIPANLGRPIKESDYKIILDELRKNLPVTFEQPVRPKQRIQAPTPIAATAAEEPHHDTIRDMIREIGLMENKISETEYPMDGWRLDVAWKRVSAGFPSHAFEVQVGGNFYEALSKLKHAYDIWNSKPILVTTEKYAEDARNLLQGSFHEIRDVASIVNWKRVSRLYELLKEAEATRKDVGL